jgi:hypothetical protein
MSLLLWDPRNPYERREQPPKIKNHYETESFGRDKVAEMFGFGDKRMDFGADLQKYREFAGGGGDQKVPDLADDALTQRRMTAVRSGILRGADRAASGYARAQGGGSGSAASGARTAALRAIAGGAASRAADDVMQGERLFRAEIDRSNLDRRQRGLSDILGFGTNWRAQNISLLGLLDDRAKTRLGLDDAQRNRDLQEKIARWQHLNKPVSFVIQDKPKDSSEKRDTRTTNTSDTDTPPDGGGGGTGGRVTDANDVDNAHREVLRSSASAPKGSSASAPKARLAWRHRT